MIKLKQIAPASKNLKRNYAFSIIGLTLKFVIATITGHRSESEYKRITNGRKQLYSQNHPPHIHLSGLKENSVLIAPLGKTPMVVTQTLVLLSAIEGADIERVIVIHPNNSEIRNGVGLLKEAFRRKKRAITSIEIKDIRDVRIQ